MLDESNGIGLAKTCRRLDLLYPSHYSLSVNEHRTENEYRDSLNVGSIMIKLNCTAVDDEPLALRQISTFLEQIPFLKMVGQYTSAVEVLQAPHEQQIDWIKLRLLPTMMYR